MVRIRYGPFAIDWPSALITPYQICRSTMS
jgi:hypothetical protein